MNTDDVDPRTIEPDPFIPGASRIPLRHGGYALVDDEDVCRVDEYDWYKSQAKAANTAYALAHFRRPDGSKTVLFMHRVIFGLTQNDRIMIDHKNRNGLDNRRKDNLRIASSAQNTTNSRKRLKTSSQYKGVTWQKAQQKWYAITTVQNGSKLSIGLGAFEIEEEAAFAFHVAAPLTRDPAFLCLVPIPEDKMPSPERQAEIRAIVLVKIKARLVGKKGTIGATSKFLGVSRVPGPNNERRWRASIRVGGKSFYTGFYATEIEAGFAHDYTAIVLKLTDHRLNKIEPKDLNSPGRADEIRAEVRRRIETPEIKARPGATSRFWGVSYATKRNKWIAAVGGGGKKMFQIGEFRSEIEAALAYNVALPILAAPNRYPNVITPDEMPPEDVARVVRDKTLRRLESRLTKA